MEKKVLLGVQKSRPSKRNKKKSVNKVIDYLKSDSYLFAPLISSSASEAVKGNNMGSVKKVEEYLKSDSYMYASLVIPPQSSGLMLYHKSVITEVSTQTSTLEYHQLTVELEKGKYFKDHSTKKVLSDQQTSVHMIYQNCRSSSMKRDARLAARKLC
ncbi:hypothetical protein FNV43_RR03298 [Rhamnella rubrinervis]|uniref:Uncharacterized protein n=1 Tax=Rhamnella rubrinervis TaxID=2594499 RepID=A0A8K0HJJ3_9ROSA|nr:hypothetical protein FNV43_RR03298 [Rhamnella rubrinervis]